MSRIRLSLRVGVVTGLLTSLAVCRLTAAGLSEPELVHRLTHEEKNRRISAYRTLNLAYDAVNNKLVELAGGEDPDNSIHSTKSYAIQLLGERRIANAVDVLLDNLLYRPDRIFVDSETQRERAYVAAVALTRIGLPCVLPVVLHVEREETTEAAADLCAWILIEVLGQDGATRRAQELAACVDPRSAKRGALLVRLVEKRKPRPVGD